MLEENQKIPLTYFCSGPKIGSAPVVLVNHPLTANAIFSGKNGWWNQIIGEKK